MKFMENIMIGKIESKRNCPLDMTSKDFKKIGYHLIDQIAGLLDSYPDRPITSGEPPSKIKDLLGNNRLPEHGTASNELFDELIPLLFNHSLFDGHPKFLGYITSSPAPIGALADLLAAAINPNVAAWSLSPVASEIEWQTIRWIAEMIGYPNDSGGILVSGGNMANLVCFLTARNKKCGWDIREEGMSNVDADKLLIYTSKETHSWIQKAAAHLGNGTRSIRWIGVDSNLCMDTDILETQIKKDIDEGFKPFMVIGTGGSVGTGAVDPLPEISKICKDYNLWFHVDGAYGAFAAVLPDAPKNLLALKYADSIALDPHKWLYAPLEAGCVLVRNSDDLKKTFSYHPSYYKFDEFKGEKTESFFDYGLQNSRSFRALKVWLGLKQAGRSGYEQMISDDIKISQVLFNLANQHPELEAITNNLSITTFRFVPESLQNKSSESNEYLNKLNMEILTRLQVGGKAYVSHAWVKGKYVLRLCIVNFRTTEKDIAEIVDIITSIGQKVVSESKKKM